MRRERTLGRCHRLRRDSLRSSEGLVLIRDDGSARSIRASVSSGRRSVCLMLNLKR